MTFLFFWLSLRSGLRDVRQSLAEQEPRVRAKIQSEYEQRMQALQREMVLLQHKFEAYRKQTATHLLAAVAETRKEQLGALADMGSPLDSKRMQLALVNQGARYDAHISCFLLLLQEEEEIIDVIVVCRP